MIARLAYACLKPILLAILDAAARIIALGMLFWRR